MVSPFWVFSRRLGSAGRGGGGAGNATDQRGVSKMLSQKRISLTIGFCHFACFLATTTVQLYNQKTLRFGLCVELRDRDLSEVDATICFVLATEVKIPDLILVSAGDQELAPFYLTDLADFA